MFTKIFTRNYFVQTWLTVIIVINGLEVLVMRPGRADDFVLSQQPSTLEATGELIINGTLNEKGKQGSYQLSWRQASAKEESLICLLYTSPSPRDKRLSRMPSSA